MWSLFKKCRVNYISKYKKKFYVELKVKKWFSGLYTNRCFNGILIKRCDIDQAQTMEQFKILSNQWFIYDLNCLDLKILLDVLDKKEVRKL